VPIAAYRGAQFLVHMVNSQNDLVNAIF